MPSLFSPRVCTRLHCRLLCLAIGVAGLLDAIPQSSAAGVAPAPLTLAAAQHLALARSRQLAAQDFSVQATREMAIAAGQLPDPVLKIGIDNLPVSGPDRFSPGADFMTMRRIGVMQEMTREDKRAIRTERLEATARKTLAEKDLTTAAIERDTAIAWLALYYAQAMAELIQEQATQAALEVQAADGAYRAGRGSQADLLMARAASAAIDNRSSDVQRLVRSARTMLTRWVGDGADLRLDGRPSIDVINLSVESLDTQLAHHPEIAVLTRQQEIAESEARLANANRRSDWSVEVAFQQRGAGYSNMASIGVSIPFQWDQRNRQDRELSARLAGVEQAKAERDDMLRDHVARTRAMLDQWHTNLEQQRRYASDLIPLANQRTAAVMTAYQGGKASLADLLAARRNEIEMREKALQLEADTALLWAQLNFLSPTQGVAARAVLPTMEAPK